MPETENAVFDLLQHPRVPETRKPGICLSLGNMAGPLLAKDSTRAMALTNRLLHTCCKTSGNFPCCTPMPTSEKRLLTSFANQAADGM